MPDYCKPDTAFVYRYACELAQKEERWLSERSQLQADVKSVTRERDQDLKMSDEVRDMLEKLGSILPEKLSIKLVPTSVMCGECTVTPEERLRQLEIEDRNVGPELLEYVRHLPDEEGRRRRDRHLAMRICPIIWWTTWGGCVVQLPLMQDCFPHCPGTDTWQLWSTSSHLMRTHMTSAKLATTVSKLIDGIEENERSVR